MKTIHEFQPADRYTYDFGVCSSSKGFAQVDTGQDASYFGTWANPTSLQIICYCEGDVTLQTADDKDEFIAAIRKLKTWNEDSGHRFIGIDPMLNAEIEGAFKKLGLGDLLH